MKSGLKKIWENKTLIFSGIRNWFFKTKYTEQIAHERMEICFECDKYDLSGTDCAVPHTQPCCGQCGCSLKLKVRSLESECPLGKWDAVQ